MLVYTNFSYDPVVAVAQLDGKDRPRRWQGPALQPRMLKVAGSIPGRAWLHRFILCTKSLRTTAHESWRCDQSIGSTVIDAIVRSWLWSTATRSYPWATLVVLLQVVDNWPDSILIWGTPGHRRLFLLPLSGNNL